MKPKTQAPPLPKVNIDFESQSIMSAASSSKMNAGSRIAQEGQIEEEIRVFRNLRSKIFQWYYSNIKLTNSFEQQELQAKVR